MIKLYQEVGPKPIKINDPESFVGRKIAKAFFNDERVYVGKITAYDSEGLWEVEYEDGDQEDFDASEVVKYTNFFDDNAKDLILQSSKS